MYDGLQVAQLPLRPLVEGSVNHRIVVAGINEQHLVANVGVLVAVEEPQRAGQGERVEEIVAHADHHIHITCAHQFLTDVTVFIGAVSRRTGHYEASTTMVVQVGIEITNPKIVGITYLFGLLIHARKTEGQAASG